MAVVASCDLAVDEQPGSLESIQRSHGMKSDAMVIGSSIAPLTSPSSINWELEGYPGINVASINYLFISPIPSDDHFCHKPLVSHRGPALTLSLQDVVPSSPLLPSHPVPLDRTGPSRLGLVVCFLPFLNSWRVIAVVSRHRASWPPTSLLVTSEVWSYMPDGAERVEATHWFSCDGISFCLLSLKQEAFSGSWVTDWSVL